MPSWNSLKNSVVLPKLNLKMALFTQNIAMALGVVIFEIIGLALYPIVFTSITSANVGGKVIGSNAVLVNLVPLFYAIILISVPIGVAIKLLSDTT